MNSIGLSNTRRQVALDNLNAHMSKTATELEKAGELPHTEERLKRHKAEASALADRIKTHAKFRKYTTKVRAVKPSAPSDLPADSAGYETSPEDEVRA
jgi:hypothetical protein